MYYISLLLPVLVALTTAADLKDEPPNIIAISALIGIEPEPDVLTEPQDYVITADIGNSPKAKNILRCRASNADQIKWQYRESDGDAWVDDLPDIMVAQSIDTIDSETNTVELDISDGSTSRIEELQTLNGYYRCMVENTEYGSKSQSAAVKLVVPYVLGTRPEEMDITDSPKEGEPFALPCFAQDAAGNGYRLVPEDAANFVRISYKWTYRVGPDTFDYPDDIVTENPSRIKVDPLTGTLYWAYVVADDAIPRKDPITNDAVKLQCRVSVGSLDEIFTASDYADLRISTNTADISDPNVEILTPGYDIQNGEKIAKEDEVPVCTSGEQCRIVAIFGGRAINEDSKVVGISTADQNNRINSKDNTGFEFTAPIGEEQVSYDCVLYDAGSGTDLEKLLFNIKISNYPRLLDRTYFPEKPRLVQAGNDVKFECDAEHVSLNTKFFINGVQVSNGNPPYVTYNEAVDTEFQVKNAQRDNSFSVQCESKNEAGTLYTTSVLNVYDAPIVKQYPLEDILRPANDNDTLSYLLNCSFTLDIKTSAAKLYWRTDQEGFTGPITDKKSDKGVSDIVIEEYDPATGIIASRLTLGITTESQHVLPNTNWWCVVEYSVLDEKVENVESKKINFDFEEVVPTAEPVVNFNQYPLVIGVAAGVIFLILIIVLINCYVQKNKGEQYYVDEKERKAGHNPEEEMEAYGFSDYTRPDQNPIKGSRASMNISDGKPMESDTGSLDEYGADVDPSRYNEDGSFIGQYGQNGHSSRNQADV